MTDVRFLHEFPPGADIDASNAEHAPRFAALAERWRELATSRRRALFVRQHAWDPIRARRFRRTPDAAAPALDYTLLCLTETEGPRWGKTRILKGRLRQPATPDWRGDNHAWSELFAGVAAPLASSASVET
ncbi:MAG: hypothetical protein ACREH4_12500 [Vitreimonas sp.]